MMGRYEQGALAKIFRGGEKKYGVGLDESRVLTLWIASLEGRMTGKCRQGVSPKS
jgi:hypothetical protein